MPRPLLFGALTSGGKSMGIQTGIDLEKLVQRFVEAPGLTYAKVDVADPANPKFLSWYRSTQCEGAAIANNCGAFVDLSPDGERVYINHTGNSALSKAGTGDVLAGVDPAVEAAGRHRRRLVGRELPGGEPGLHRRGDRLSQRAGPPGPALARFPDTTCPL